MFTNGKQHMLTTYSHGLDSPESCLASKHIHLILFNYTLINKALTSTGTNTRHTIKVSNISSSDSNSYNKIHDKARPQEHTKTPLWSVFIHKSVSISKHSPSVIFLLQLFTFLLPLHTKPNADLFSPPHMISPLQSAYFNSMLSCLIFHMGQMYAEVKDADITKI